MARPVTDVFYLCGNNTGSMELWMDDQATERQYRELLSQISMHRSGEVADLMKQRGILYKMNWGVSLTDLRAMAAEVRPSHLLALKLWNKQWRETMILATLVDEPGEVTEQQMDYWTHRFENIEIAEQASANLWWRTPFAYAKALEWCRGKKHLIRFTAVHLAGRLALSDRKSPDEMFEPFMEEMVTLSRDKTLTEVILRSLMIMAQRSAYLRELIAQLAATLESTEHEASRRLAAEIGESLPFTM